MILNLGTVKPGSTVYIPFQTYDSNDPSASVTITGLAVTDIEIYKNGSTTQRASDAGYSLLDTDGIDFDTITGIHGFSLDLADNTTSGFFVAGAQFWVVISSITVDAATINFLPVVFTIGYPGALLDTTIATLSSQTSFTLSAGSADDDAYNGWTAVIHDVASAVQIALGVVSDYTGSTKTVTLAADPGIFTMAAGDNISLFPPANVTAWNAVPLASTNPLPNAAPAANGGLPTVNASNYVAGIQGTLNTLDALDTAQDSQHSTTQSAIATAQADLDTITGSDGVTLATAQGNYAPAKAGDAMTLTAAATSAQLVDDVWDEVITGAAHNVNNSAAKFLREASNAVAGITGTAQTGTSTTITLESGAVTSNDILNGNRIQITGGTGIGQSRLITDSVITTDVCTVDRAWDVTPDATSEYTITGADADIRAVEGNDGATDNLLAFLDGTGYAGGTIKLDVNIASSDDIDLTATQKASVNAECDTAISDASLATAAALATVDSNVDAVLVDTGTTLPAVLGTPAGADLATDIAAVKTDTAAILADTGTDGVVIAAAQTVATVTDVTNRVTANTDQIAGSATAATNLSASAAGVVSSSVNDASATTTSFITALTEATDDHYNDRVMVFTSGALAGQATDITDYTGATKTVTVTALTEAPGNGDTFVIV